MWRLCCGVPTSINDQKTDGSNEEQKCGEDSGCGCYEAREGRLRNMMAIVLFIVGSCLSCAMM